MIQDSVSLYSLMTNNRGLILFLYSDTYSVFVVYHDLEENELYILVCDKQLTVTAARLLEAPEQFLEYQNFQWHRPIRDNVTKELVFVGTVTLDNKKYYFTIRDDDKVVLASTVYEGHDFKILPMKSLDRVTVETYIQKSNQIFAIGCDEKMQQVFIHVDMVADKALRHYVLLSDVGEVVCNTINIDRGENKVYVGGYICDRYDQKVIAPYFEIFLMPADGTHSV